MHRAQKIVSQLSIAATSLPKPKLVELTTSGRVGIITMNRPEALNALSDELRRDIATGINYFNRPDLNFGCIILTGKGRAFAAGADIKGMVNRTSGETVTNDPLNFWDTVRKSQLPIIAAVNGIAFGGGCEIAMMCDIIIAADNAKFGQPEIKIGIIPGAGGTQRLPKFIGKSKAMEMNLTGRPITAQEAEKAGLVSSVVPADKLMEKALDVAQAIAANSRPVVVICKEAVNTAFETSLEDGLQAERRLFAQTFNLADRKEGMTAFVEKRAPKWQHR